MKEKLTLADIKEDQIVKVENWGYGRIISKEKSTCIMIEFELDESIKGEETCEAQFKLNQIKEIVKKKK